MTTDSLRQSTLTYRKQISPDVYWIGYKRQDTFSPGQVVKLTLDKNIPPRIYSICSGRDESEIRILFNIKESGLLTPKLAELPIGSPLFVSAPYGSFLDTSTASWWIATGTGIAPFYSMMRSGMHSHKTLLHGFRFRNQAYFETECLRALGENYHRCCSAETGKGIYSGRVTDFLKAQVALPVDHRYYICGQASMAVEVRDILIAKGIPFTNISTEIYF